MAKRISIYVHIPFCEKKCSYCDFASSEDGDIDGYVMELCDEIASSPVAKRLEVTVASIYIGGGTPSFLLAEQISRIVATIQSTFQIEIGAEITIECNPNSMTEGKLMKYRKIGINRISIGIQSFNDKTLKILGRVHDVKTAMNAIDMASKYFQNINIDLIHSVPRGKLVLPKKYLKMVQHVSAYCLTSDRFPKIDDNKSIHEQRTIERTLAKLGIYKYEISNFCRPDCESRHNMNYWQCGEWLGFGESAEGHFDEPWKTEDKIMLGLRLVRGVPAELLDDKKGEVLELLATGFLQNVDGRICCTEKGFLLHNKILEKLA